MVREEFSELMNDFTEFYGTCLNKIQTMWWYDTFKSVSVEDFGRALDWHIHNDQFNSFPAPGKITYALEQVNQERFNNPEYPQFTGAIGAALFAHED